MIKIIPALLAKTSEELESMIHAVEPFVDLAQIDIADGEFVPNKTIEGYEELMNIETKLDFEVHLMVSNPYSALDKWFKTKAVRFLIHFESANDEIETLINQVHMNNREFGVVFNPETDYSLIEPYIERIDLVQFMTVDPGFYGSPFLPEVLDKIRNFYLRYPNKIIQVDGGINPETLKLVEASGASRAAVGSYIFKSNNIKEALEKLNV